MWFLQAATPRALEIYVFPLPDAPFKMIWWLSELYLQVDSTEKHALLHRNTQ